MLRGIAYSPTLSLARLEVAARRLFVDDQLVVLGVGNGLGSNRNRWDTYLNFLQLVLYRYFRIYVSAVYPKLRDVGL